MKKSITKLLCLFLFFSVIMVGCSYTGLYKYSKKINEYSLNITLNESEHTLVGEEKISYINNSEVVLTNVDFHLYPNAFKEQDSIEKPISEFNYNKAYPNGFDSGYIDIEEVKIKNEKANYELLETSKTILKVNLKEKLYPSQRVDIHIKFNVKIPNVNHRFGYGASTINLGNFYPIVCKYENGGFVHDGYHYNGDPFYSEMANYDVKITYPKNLKMASTGECKSKSSSGENITENIKAKVVRDFAFVFSDKFKILDREYKNTKIYYMYYYDSEPNNTLDLIYDTLETFNNLIGNYPYSTLTVVQCNFVHGGMEFPNLALVSDEIEGDDYANVVVHEIAHQWFYNIIGNDEVKEAWLDEGLTEYSTLMFFELNPKYGISYDELFTNMQNSYLLFVDVYEDVFGKLDTSMNRSLYDFSSEFEYTYLVYVKPVLMLDNLREMIGDASFCLGLKTYYENNKFGIATKDKFIRDFGKVTHIDIKGIVNSWVNGTVEIKQP